jgi:hypothetical protein
LWRKTKLREAFELTCFLDELCVMPDIISTEDGRQGLEELQGTKTFTWELSVCLFPPL